MPAYMIGRLTIKNTDWLAEYQPKTQALVAKHGGKYIVAGADFERLEGSGEPPNGLVVLEFPTRAAAEAWYNDPEYREMIALRQTGADGEIFIAEGAG
ncbi:MAG: DUF1330 domain-containing protein [Alphaproteobacteria bacterium]